MELEKKPSGEIAQQLGALLKKTREEQALSVADAANKLHLKQSFVNALESGDYQVIDSMVYVKGYLRIYARLLQINIDPEIPLVEAEAVNAAKTKPLHSRAVKRRTKIAKLNASHLKRTVYQKKYRFLLLAVAIVAGIYGLSRHDSPAKMPAPLPLASVDTSHPASQSLTLPPSSLAPSAPPLLMPTTVTEPDTAALHTNIKTKSPNGAD